jgi:hypothetical protein
VNTPNIVWTSDPPPPEGRYIPVIRANAAGPMTFAATGSAIIGTDLHWDPKAGKAGRTFPHYEPADTCPLCARAMARRWRAYLSCYSEHMGRSVLMELTPDAVRNCLAIREPGEEGLRGKLVTIRRAHPTKFARVIVSVGDLWSKWRNLPDAVDVRAALMRLWGLAWILTLPADPPPDKVI